MQNAYGELKSYIEAQKKDMLALWEELVNTESGSRQIDGVNKVAGILQREMEKAGLTTKIFPMENAGNTLVGTWNNGSSLPPLLFVGHMDTVFKPGAVQENPFRIDDQGLAHGPGVLDMKAGLVIALYALKALQAVGWQERPLKCIFAGDEENLHMFSTARELIMQEAKGASAAFNFETGYTDDGIVVGRKGGTIVTLTIQGVAAHSGIAPEKGRSAILEAAHKIIDLESRNNIARGKLINCGLVQGGIGENTIPGACEIHIGARFGTLDVQKEIVQDIQEAAAEQHVPGTSTVVKTNMLIDCMETTPGVQALFAQVEQTARSCGYGKVYPLSIGGVSDSGIVVACGVPTVCGMGVKGKGNHTATEFAVVDSLFARCYLAACSVHDLKM